MKKFIIILATGLSATSYITATELSTAPAASSHDTQQAVTVYEPTAATFDTLVLKADKPVVVDFYATWCGPCRDIKPVYADLAGEHTDWLFTAVDVDKEPELAARYGVRAMPTFAVFKNGIHIGNIVGKRNKDRLMQELKDLLASK